jgi:outer membrane protein TolC
MTRKLTLLCLLCAPLPCLAAPAFAEAPLEVGKVSDLDLDVFRQTVDEIQPDVPSGPSDRRTLSLEEAIVIALENNLRLQVAQLDAAAVETTVPEARARFDPLLGATGLATETKEDLATGPNELDNRYSGTASVQQNIPTGALLTATGDYLRRKNGPVGNAPVDEIAGFTVEVTQPLLRGGRIYVARRFITDAEYEVDFQRAALAAEILRVTANTKAFYYDAIRTTRLVEVVNDAIERDKELLAASQALFEAGRVNKRDVYSAQISLAKDQATLASREGSKDNAQNLLRDELGLPIDMQIDIAELEIPFRPVEIQLDDWIQSALETRPELAQVRARIGQFELNTHVRENFVLPSLDARGLYGRAANTQSHLWESQLTFSIPFGNVGARSALSRARIEQARVERQYVQQERAIELAVRNLAIQLEEAIGRLRADVTGLENARAKREVATVRFQLGLANNLDITDANDDVSTAETDLLDAVWSYATSLAFLEAAIGRPI